MSCQVTQALLPIVAPLLAIIVLQFIGAFGGRVGKVIAIAGIIFLFLWYVGLTWMGIPLDPLRRYAGMVIAPLMTKEVRHVQKQPTSKWTYAGVALVFVAVILFVLMQSKVI